MTRLYRYVGSHDLLKLLQNPVSHYRVDSPEVVLRWIKETRQELARNGVITATFIIDTEEQLWISDQRSEHVVCARGQAVLSAGEMTFRVQGQRVEIIEITNQSTGYCPELESWEVVAQTLASLDIEYPDSFTSAYLFRWCIYCQTTNLIKDGWFDCAVCQSSLSADWNYEQHPSYEGK